MPTTIPMLEPQSRRSDVTALTFLVTEPTVALNLRELSPKMEPAFTARYVTSGEPASFVVSEQVDQRVEVAFEDYVGELDPVLVTVVG